MQLQYMVLPARDLTIPTLHQIIEQGWTMNDPSLVVLSRPVPPPALPAGDQPQEIIDATPAPE